MIELIRIFYPDGETVVFKVGSLYLGNEIKKITMPTSGTIQIETDKTVDKIVLVNIPFVYVSGDNFNNKATNEA